MRIGLHECLLVLPRQVSVVVLLFGIQGGPPLSQYLGDRTVLEMRILLPYNGSVSLAEDEKGVHGSFLGLLARDGRCISGQKDTSIDQSGRDGRS